jgi:hypothetical protein
VRHRETNKLDVPKMRKHVVPATIAAFLSTSGLAVAQQPAPAAPASVWSGSFSLTTGVDYSTGKYGGTSSTDIIYVPLTGKLETLTITFDPKDFR